jgi:hypothetical protein
MAPVDLVLLLRSLDTMSDLALIYDRHYKRVYANRAAQRLGELARAFDPWLEEVYRTRDKVVARIGNFETIYSPILGDNGNPQFVIAVARDVSELKAYSTISESTSDSIRPSEPDGGSTAERNESVGARSTVETCDE